MKKPVKILHLEDSPSDALLIGKILKKDLPQIEILVVDNKNDFVHALQQGNVDIILSDHSLVGFNSHEALEIFQQTDLQIPFILLTAAMTDEFAADIIKKGAADYILKDRLQRLPSALLNALEKCRLLQERQNYIQELESNEKRFRALIENSADAIAILSQSGNPIYISSTFTQILGYTEAEALSMTIYQLVHPSFLKKAELLMAEALANPGLPLKDNVALFKHKKGHWAWVETTLTNLLPEAGIGGLVANFRDISKRREAEIALLDSEEKYRSFFENSSDGILLTTPNGPFLAANPAVCAMFQMTAEEMCAEGSNRFADSFASQLKTALLQSETEGKTKAEVNFTRKDGKLIYCEITSSIYQNSNAKPRTSIIIRDISEKEAMLTRLKDSEAKLRNAQKIARLGYWEVSLETNDLFWSDETYAVWGRKKEEYKPSLSSLYDLVYPEDLTAFTSVYQDALDNSKNRDLEFRAVLPDGTLKWILGKGKIVKDAHDVPVIFEGTVQDINEQKIAQEKLEVSEARHRGLIQSQTNYVIRTDLQGNYSYCNDKFLSDFGWLYPENSIIGIQSLQSIKEYHHQRVKDTVANCLNFPNKVFQTEMDKPTHVGGTKTTIWDFICLTNANGEPTEIQCVGIDITDRVKAEQEFLKLYDEKNTIMESIGDAFFAVDQKWEITYWNKQAEKMLNLPKSSVLGKNLWKVFPMANSTPFQSHYRRAMKEKNIQLFEAFDEIREKWFEATAYPSSSGLSVYFKDITERKTADFKLIELHESLQEYTKELVIANTELRQFSYIVSHNLRAPTANIIGLVRLLLQNKYDASSRETFLKGIDLSVSHLDSIIQDLNLILQVKKEGSQKREKVVLSQVIENIMLSIQQEIQQEQAQIICDFIEVGELNTIKGYLHSIFYNLILNSLKYRQPGVPPVIQIKTRKVENVVILSVSDNGSGIDLIKREHQIFGLYKRFHKEKDGKGMGLFMVKTQVEMLGGKISVESAPNQGTTFRIEFKLTE